MIWVIHICWLASGLGGERFQWNLPYYFHITHFFYHLSSKYDNLPTFTHHVYLRVEDIERAWLTRSVAPSTLIHFDFYTFLADTRTTIHIGAILLASVLCYYMLMFVLRSFYGVLIHLHIFIHYLCH